MDLSIVEGMDCVGCFNVFAIIETCLNATFFWKVRGKDSQ